MTESSNTQKVSGMDFVSTVTNVDEPDESQRYELEHGRTNKVYEIILQSVNRKKVLDEIGKISPEMIELMSAAEDENDIEEMAGSAQVLSAMDGDTIGAFENLCAMGMNDPDGELTSHHFEDICEALGFEVLFDMGARIMEMSLDEGDKITDFREVN